MTNRSDTPLHVLMVTEGTYPFHWGGVSTWCHLLLTDLPNIDFTLLSIVGDPAAVPQFTLSSNVVDFRPVALWGVRERLETDVQLDWRELLRRKTVTGSDALATKFVPLFRSFLEQLYADTCDPEYLAKVIHDLHRFFLTHDFDTALRSAEAWECFRNVVGESFPRVAAQSGYVDERYSLADVTTCMQWLYHWFFPLARPLPETDVVHAAMAGVCTLVAVAAKLEHGAAYMLTEHGVYLRERYLAEATTSTSLFRKIFSLRFARRMSELSYTLADQIAPCCDYNQRWELRNGARQEQIRTIYYGVDSVVFTPTEKPADEPPVVVWVGRIDPLKDVLTLLRAAALVHKERPDIQFRLFGSAPPGNESYYEQCLQLHKELGLEDIVIFAGFSSNPASAFNQGDIAILSSVSEAFPFVILEAMLCEKPVVATAVGGVPEQIMGCGIAVEPRNPDAMASGILTLMDDPQLRSTLGKAAREKAIQEYSVRQSGMAHENAYRRLVARRNPEPTRELPYEQEASEPSATDTVEIPLDPEPVMLQVSNREVATRVVVSHNGNHVNGSAFAGQDNSLGIAYRPSTVIPGSATNGNGNGKHNGNGHANGNGHSNANGHSNGNGYSNGHKPGQSGMNGTQQPSSAIAQGWRIEHMSAIIDLANEIVQKDVDPIDSLEITALLESMGITDSVAQRHYDAPDCFALGEAVLAQMKANGLPARPVERLPGSFVSRMEQLQDYAKGPLGLVPPLVLMLIIATFHQLGGWNERQLLLLGAGMTTSLIVSNGVNQAVGRRTAIYLGMRKPDMAARFLWLSTSISAGGVISMMSVIVFWAASRFNIPSHDYLIFFLSFVGLSIIWLAGGALPLVRRALWLTIALCSGWITGVIAAVLAEPHLQYHILVGTSVGFVVTLSITFLALRNGFTAQRSGASHTSTRMALPPVPYLISEASAYFAYGLLYMVFILIPHLFGWYGSLAEGQSRIWAVTNTEVGLTLSLPPLILAYGVAEHALRRFWRRAAVVQAETPGKYAAWFGQSLNEYRKEQFKTYAFVLFGLTIAGHLAFRLVVATGLLEAWLHVPDMTQLSLIFNASLVAYALVGIGLFNAMFPMTLGRPDPPIRALLAATAVMIVVGAIFSVIGYSYSAVAFALAALTFAVIAQRTTKRVLASADYYYASL